MGKWLQWLSYYQQSGKCVLVESLLCALAWSCCYLRSLRGGDLEEIKETMAELGLFLFAALLILTYAVWRLILTPAKHGRHDDSLLPFFGRGSGSYAARPGGRFSTGISSPTASSSLDEGDRRLYYTRGLRALLLAAHFTLLLLLHFVDRGVDFEHHGSYNFLILAVLLVPLNIAIATVVTTQKLLGHRRFAQFALGAAVFIGTVLVFKLHSAAATNALGFFDGSPSNEEDTACVIPRATPWFDIMPARAQTFWLGGLSCAPKPPRRKRGSPQGAEVGFEATLDDAGWLNVTCAKPYKAVYSVLPHTRTWPRDWKGSQPIDNSLQDHVLAELAKNWQSYTQPVRLHDATGVLVRCDDAEKLVIGIPDSPEAQAKAAFWQRFKRSLEREGSPVPPERLPPNVLMIFLDAVSRKQFFRRLPETVYTLESIGGEPASATALYQFFKYHVLGFNTGPNTRALYAGEMEETGEYREPIWKTFKNSGQYVSGVVQGRCEDWSGLYQLASGREAEVDYELASVACLPEYEPVNWSDRGNFQSYTSIKKRCLHGSHFHEWELAYMRKFIAKFRANYAPWFLVASFMEGHEGTGEVLAQIDQNLAEFLSTAVDHDNTVTVIISDHGPHMGLNFLYFADGLIAHRTPFLAMLIPKHLQTEGLRQNADKLLTAHDVYATLLHLLHSYDWAKARAAASTTHSISFAPIPQTPPTYNQTSLFEPLPRSRTCADLGITDDTCVCKNRDAS